MLKEVIIFASGAMVGAAIAVPITKKRIGKREKDLENQNQSKDEYIKELEERIKLDELAVGSGYIQKEEENGAVDSIVRSVKQAKKDEKKIKPVFLKPPIRDYTVYYSSKAESEHPREDDIGDYIMETEEIRDNRGPNVVSYEEYWSPEYEYHEKVELNYFTEDEILANPENEVIENAEILIGNALRSSGFTKNDEKVIYVRNYELCSDYEIAKVFGAYADTV